MSASVAALLITALPYECPTATTGPSTCAKTDAKQAESATIPRSGFAGAITRTPFACSRAITPFQLDASANAP